MKNARRLPNICKNTKQIQGSLLNSFIYALFLYHFRLSLLEVSQKHSFPSFFSFLLFLNQRPNTRQTRFAVQIKNFMLETNTLMLETNALKMCVQTSATRTQLATSDFQTDFTYVKMIATHRQSPLKNGWYPNCSRTHLQVHVCYTHKLHVHTCIRNSVFQWTKWSSNELS